MSPGRRVRRAAVAGSFYPAAPTGLRREIHRAFSSAVVREAPAAPPVALIVPHAGYVYSGPIAASAYRLLESQRSQVRRVVLLGPTHRVPLRGLGLSSADAWETPLGSVPLDTEAATALASLPGVSFDDRAHRDEHSLEVQVPFLQTVLDTFFLLPIVVGDASTGEVATVLDAVWPNVGTLVVVSTDLSHYHPYEAARAIDGRTVAHIVARAPEEIADDDACGARPLRGLLSVATASGLEVDVLDVRNSGDTAGCADRVVGYGAFALH